MSSFVVLDDLGSEASSLSESIQNEEQGELGVTCKAMEDDVRSPRMHVNRKRCIMVTNYLIFNSIGKVVYVVEMI